MITSYAFGKMSVDGRRYTSDLMILPDGRVRKNWRRQTGHVLTPEDLSELTKAHPGMIIAGTGSHGRMVPSPDLKAALAEKGIEVQAMDTASAAALYNRLISQGGFPAACFHLTC